MSAPEGLFVRPGLVIPEGELHVEFSRSGGPGGQNVNKVSSRVTLRWSLARSHAVDATLRARLEQRLASRLTSEGELVLHASASRSQLENRRAARERLAALLRAALEVPRERRSTKPTRASRSRRLEGKRRRSAAKQRRGRPAQDD